MGYQIRGQQSLIDQGDGAIEGRRERVMLRLEASLLAALRERAAETGASVSALLRGYAIEGLKMGLPKPKREVNRFYGKRARDNKELFRVLKRAAILPDHYALYQFIRDPEWFEWDYLIDDASTGSQWCRDWQPYAVVGLAEGVEIRTVDPDRVGKGETLPGVEVIWLKS